MLGMMRKRKKHTILQPSFSGFIRHLLLLAAIFYLGINTYSICMFHHQTSSSASGQDDGDASPNKNKVQINNNTIRKGKGKQRSQGPPNMPDNWTTMDFFDIRKYFTCKEYAHNTNKPLPTLADWQFFIDRYKKVVDKDANFDNAVLPTDGYDFDGMGNPPPYYARHGDRGRGLFASRDIKKGELVHDGNKSDIQFPSDDDGLAWRRLVFNLPRNKACDVIDWSWTAQTEKGGKYKLFSAVDISVLCNGGNDDTINVNPLSEFTSEMYATRDIKKGEELLMDYDI